VAQEAARPNHPSHLDERLLDRGDVLERRAGDEEVEARGRKVHPSRVHGDEADGQSPEDVFDVGPRSLVCQHGARQPPRPLAAVALLEERELEIDARHPLDGVEAEEEAVDAGAAAHLENARPREGASPAREL
jgi:hypothetical protein